MARDRLAAAEGVDDEGGGRSTVVAARGERLRERASLGDRRVGRLEQYAAAALEAEARAVERLLRFSPRSTRFATKFRWLWGWIGPPIEPNAIHGAPPRSSMPGMMVWSGRFRGASAFGWPGSRRKPAPRLWSTMPVSPQPTPEPKP